MEKTAQRPQYAVLFEEDTERWARARSTREHRDGTFVCSACFLPLFEVEDEIRQRYRMAELFRQIPGRVANAHRLQVGIAAHRVPLRALQRHQGHVFDDGRRRPANATATTRSPCFVGYRRNSRSCGVRRWKNIPRDSEARTMARRLGALHRGAFSTSLGAQDRTSPGRRRGTVHPRRNHMDGPAEEEADTATLPEKLLLVVEPRSGSWRGVISVTSAVTRRTRRTPPRRVSRCCRPRRVGPGSFDASKVTYVGSFSTSTGATSIRTARDHQFYDVGHQYRTTIFQIRPEQKSAWPRHQGQHSKNAGSWRTAIAAEIAAASTFYPGAEDYRQVTTRRSGALYNSTAALRPRPARLKELLGESPIVRSRRRTSTPAAGQDVSNYSVDFRNGVAVASISSPVTGD